MSAATLETLRAELAALGPPPARLAATDSDRIVAERVAYYVARFAVDRWERAGFMGGTVDAQGVPRPTTELPACTWRDTGKTTPGSKTILRCDRCDTETPAPGRSGCVGGRVSRLVYPAIDYLLAGGRFELDATGMLRATGLPAALEAA